MSEDILNPLYWKKRLQQSYKTELHHSIFNCGTERWRKIEEKHREILKKHIKPHDSIFDAGCGYGRLLTLMPEDWGGWYVGVDISPEFVEMAEKRVGTIAHHFFVMDLQDLSDIREYKYDLVKFDWAILISIRPMVIRNLGQAVWDKMEKEIRSVAKQLMYLEYDPNCEGFIE